MNQEHFWTNFLPLFIYTQKFTLQKIPRTQNTHKTKTYCIAWLIRALYFLLDNLQILSKSYTIQLAVNPFLICNRFWLLVLPKNLTLGSSYPIHH